jgi:hypothetical protein
MAPPPVEPDQPKAEPATPARAGTASSESPPSLRMVPGRPAAVAPPAQPQTDAEAEALSIEAHPSGRAKKPKPSDDPDGVAKRAVVPSWDDIMFGVRRPDEAT